MQHDQITVYCFDNFGRYTGTDTADADPLEPGNYLMPANSTTLEPPAWSRESDERPHWNGEGWTLKADTELRDFHTLQMRIRRNGLLQRSDWTMLSDVLMSDTEREMWIKYRIMLRNLPAHPNWPYVEFPTDPTVNTAGKEVSNG